MTVEDVICQFQVENMSEAPRAVSIRASKLYLRVLRIIAARRNGWAVADVVRHALDAQYGREISQLEQELKKFDSDDCSNGQSTVGKDI